VIVGIAAQQSLGKRLCGHRLLVTRVFRVGDRYPDPVRPSRGQVAGAVTAWVLTYLTLETEKGRHVPNSAILSAAVGPQRPSRTARPTTRRRPVPPERRRLNGPAEVRK